MSSTEWTPFKGGPGDEPTQPVRPAPQYRWRPEGVAAVILRLLALVLATVGVLMEDWGGVQPLLFAIVLLLVANVVEDTGDRR